MKFEGSGAPGMSQPTVGAGSRREGGIQTSRNILFIVIAWKKEFPARSFFFSKKSGARRRFTVDESKSNLRKRQTSVINTFSALLSSQEWHPSFNSSRRLL